MNVAPVLYSLYRDQGLSVASGLSAAHWGGNHAASFTKLLRNHKSVTEQLGISLFEVNFLETLAGLAPSHTILVIGNSYGWSTVALALANPGARVTAIDAVVTADIEEGLRITNAIAEAAHLPLVAVRGRSPEDVPRIVQEYFLGPPDLVFIDGLHTNEQVILDFEATRKVATPHALFLFHDVQSFNLYSAMDHVRSTGLIVRRLMATPSGMGIAFPAFREASLWPVLTVYGPDEAVLAVIEDQTHYRRKLKQQNLIRRLTGRAPLPIPY